MRNLIAFAVCASISAPAWAQIVSNDGSASYGYSFSLPPARGRYQPTLSLAYNSNGRTTNYGVGWSLSENYIDTSTRATLNQDGSVRTRYALVRNGGRSLLALGSDGSYHPDVGQDFLKLSLSGGQWTAVDG